jgi:hypothetical protein
MVVSKFTPSIPRKIRDTPAKWFWSLESASFNFPKTYNVLVFVIYKKS